MASLLIASAGAQTLEHVKEFWDFTGDVQFLPGGYVTGSSDGLPGLYVYRDSRFEPVRGQFPPLLKDWDSFDWKVDYLDQIDASETLEASLRVLLPKRARVKKLIEIMLPGDKGTLALICYTRKLRVVGSNDTDILVTAALNTNPYDTRSQYRKLWSRRLQHEANYGDFQYQIVPGAGRFILLYSSATTSDAVENHLDVYRLRGLDAAEGKRKRHAATPGKAVHSR